MMRNLGRATIATIVLAAITGLAYPLVFTGISQVAFHSKAEGSIITVDRTKIGSGHIGQAWTGSQWFYGRPSAVAYDASTSSGSNLGPTSAKLADEIRKRAQAILTVERPYTPGLTVASIPDDLLLASGSGLDPDISPAAAEFQAARIAAVRHLSLAAVRALIHANTHRAFLGLFGAPHVNVLELNLALQDGRLA